MSVNYKSLAARIKSQYPEYREMDDTNLVLKINEKNPDLLRPYLPTPVDLANTALENNPLNTFNQNQKDMILNVLNENDLNKVTAKNYYDAKYQTNHDDVLLEERIKLEYPNIDPTNYSAVNESNFVRNTDVFLEPPTLGDINNFSNTSSEIDIDSVDLEGYSLRDTKIVEIASQLIAEDMINGTWNPQSNYLDAAVSLATKLDSNQEDMVAWTVNNMIKGNNTGPGDIEEEYSTLNQIIDDDEIEINENESDILNRLSFLIDAPKESFKNIPELFDVTTQGLIEFAAIGEVAILLNARNNIVKSVDDYSKMDLQQLENQFISRGYNVPENNIKYNTSGYLGIGARQALGNKSYLEDLRDTLRDDDANNGVKRYDEKLVDRLFKEKLLTTKNIFLKTGEGGINILDYSKTDIEDGPTLAKTFNPTTLRNFNEEEIDLLLKKENGKYWFINRYEQLNEFGKELDFNLAQAQEVFNTQYPEDMLKRAFMGYFPTLKEYQQAAKYIFVTLAFETPNVVAQIVSVVAGFLVSGTVGGTANVIKTVGGKKLQKVIKKDLVKKIKKHSVIQGHLKNGARTGAAYMGVTAAGRHTSSMDNDSEEIVRNLFEPIIVGAVENISEKFELNVLLSPFAKKQMGGALFNYIKNLLKSMATGAGSEGLATVGQNITTAGFDKNRRWNENIFEGFEESLAVGAFMDGGISAISQPFAKARSKVLKKPNSKNYNEFKKAINNLDKKTKSKLGNKIIFGHNGKSYIAVELDQNGKPVKEINVEDYGTLAELDFIESLTALQNETNIDGETKSALLFEYNDGGQFELGAEVFNVADLARNKIPKKPLRLTGQFGTRTKSRIGSFQRFDGTESDALNEEQSIIENAKNEKLREKMDEYIIEKVDEDLKKLETETDPEKRKKILFALAQRNNIAISNIESKSVQYSRFKEALGLKKLASKRDLSNRDSEAFIPLNAANIDKIIKLFSATKRGRFVGKIIKQIYNKFPNLVNDVRFGVESGTGGGGGYVQETNVFVIDQSLTPETFLHELIHAVTIPSLELQINKLGFKDLRLSSGTQYFNRLRELAEKHPNSEAGQLAKLMVITIEAQGLEQFVANKRFTAGPLRGMTKIAGQDSPYGLTLMVEFVTEAFANDNFQKELQSIKIPDTDKTVWSSFVDMIGRLIGYITKSKGNNVLNETLLLTERLGQQTQILTESVTDAKKLEQDARNKYESMTDEELDSELKNYGIDKSKGVTLISKGNTRKGVIDKLIQERKILGQFANRATDAAVQKITDLQPDTEAARQRIFVQSELDQQRKNIESKDIDELITFIESANISVKKSTLKQIRENNDKYFATSLILSHIYNENMMRFTQSYKRVDDPKSKIERLTYEDSAESDALTDESERVTGKTIDDRLAILDQFRSDSTDLFIEKENIESEDISEEAKARIKEITKGREFFLSLFTRSVNTRILNISPKIYRKLMSYYQTEALTYQEYQRIHRQFIKEARKIRSNLSYKDQQKFNVAILNGDWQTCVELGLDMDTIKNLTDVYARIATTLGLDPNKNYYRRNVIDYEGLLEFLQRKPTPELERWFAQKKANTPAKKVAAIKELLLSRTDQARTLQMRTIEEVTEGMLPFYADPLSNQDLYFSRIARLQARAVVFGDKLNTEPTKQANDEKGINIEEDVPESSIVDILAEVAEDDISKGDDKFNELVSLVKSILNYKPGNKWFGRFRTATSFININQLDSIIMQLIDIPITAIYTGLRATVETIGTPMNKMVTETGELIKANLKAIGIDVLDFEYRDQQLTGDLTSGTSKSKVTEEFKRYMSNFINSGFLLLKGTDFAGKTFLLKSTQKQWARLAKNNPDKLKRILISKFKDAEFADKVVNDIKNNKATSDAMLAFFMNVSEFHPITTGDNIKVLIDNPALRPVAVLMSFAFKMADRFGRQGITQLFDGTGKVEAGLIDDNEELVLQGQQQIADGIVGTFRFIICTIAIETLYRTKVREARQALRILPEEETEEEEIVNSFTFNYLWNIITINPFLNSFDLRKFVKDFNPEKYIGSRLTPPFPARDLFTGFVKALSDDEKSVKDILSWDNPKLVKLVPFIGDDLSYIIETEQEYRDRNKRPKKSRVEEEIDTPFFLFTEE